MRRWATPAGSTWDTPYLVVCFDDNCPYFVRGWKWMAERFGVYTSYRWHADPASGTSGPLPVWSKDALKNDILPEDRTDDDGTGCTTE